MKKKLFNCYTNIVGTIPLNVPWVPLQKAKWSSMYIIHHRKTIQDRVGITCMVLSKQPKILHNYFLLKTNLYAKKCNTDNKTKSHSRSLVKREKEKIYIYIKENTVSL